MIEIRGAVEGLAARLAAARGVTAAELEPVQACLEAIDGLLGKRDIDPGSFLHYVQLNMQFHNGLLELADCALLWRHIGNDMTVPVTPSIGTSIAMGAIFPILASEQAQHRAIVGAIEAGDGERAEALVRDHAGLALRSLTRLGASHGDRKQVYGLLSQRSEAMRSARALDR